MATAVLMPKLGLTMTEGTLEEWKVSEGDKVTKGQVIFSVATDKLTNDIEAEVDGTVLKILLEQGGVSECKSVIAWIGDEGEEVPDQAEASAEAPAQDAAAPAVERSDEQKEAPKAASVEPGGFVKASPYARKLAKENGVDLSQVVGTGKDGRILAKDVEAAKGRVFISPTAAKMAADLGVDPSTIDVGDRRIMAADVQAAVGGAQGAVEAEGNDLPPVKVSPLRRSIAENMKASWETSPRVTYTRPVDMTQIKALRKQVEGVSYNHVLMKVAAKVLMEMPDVNGSYADGMLTHHKHVNMGLAVEKDGGLIVPNVKNCDMLSLAEVAAETERLIEATRSGQVGMEDITGGTFTISSLGPYGITSFSPIINQPELAILGVCDIVDTPVVVDGEIVIRPMMNMSLTADHRVVDGVQAAKFLKRMAEILENPFLLI
ncbi:MAG: 2-oxo acid dehydrogenase subunit E2 [Firmicutes bacterium]|nr:2-oxo acid dehydrogenase subunit E2 [Bacillota bacterium]